MRHGALRGRAFGRPACSQISVPHRSRRPLLASRRSVGGFVAVQAYKGRLCLECSTGYYPFFGNCLECENKLGARLLQTPAAPLPRLPARGRDVCAWLPLHAHTRAFTHTPSREPAVRVCALRVFRCVSFCLQRFQQRERCSRVRRLLWRVALLAAGQPDLVRPTFDDGRVRLMHALAAFMR